MKDQPPEPFDQSASQTVIRREKPKSTPEGPSFVQSEPPSPLPALREQAPQSSMRDQTYQFSPAPPRLASSAGAEAGTLPDTPTWSLAPSPSRFGRTRDWLRSPGGRIVVPLVALWLGIAVGLSSLVWYGLSGRGPVMAASSAPGNLVIDANKAFVTQLVQDDLANAHLPGQVENVSVNLQTGAQIIIAGDDVYSLLGLQFSRHFVIYTQPFVSACVLQIHVTQADVGGLPVTNFVQTFEGNINQQLAQKPTGLPQGFTYCTTDVRTEPGDMFITYKATSLG